MLFVEQSRKRALLAELFDDNGFKRVIVFTRTKRGADRVARGLEQVGVEAASIHGDKSQRPARTRARRLQGQPARSARWSQQKSPPVASISTR